jgi:hypothetical protein
MAKISSSPARFSHNTNVYISACQRRGAEPNPTLVNYMNQRIEKHLKRFDTPESRESNLEYDLLTTEWILDKVRACEIYSQNLYAAMCNNEFVKNQVWDILKDNTWSCSWRYAGGIIADMRQEGDYIDWYCSGIRSDLGPESANTGDRHRVEEGEITDEIREDLLRLGWISKEQDTDS